MNISDFTKTAAQIRREILTGIQWAGSGHPGGSLSAVEVLLYLHAIEMQPEDKFILDKAHCVPALYAIWSGLGLEGYATLRTIGSAFQGHTSTRHTPRAVTPGGSLGQGLAVACGLALGKRLKGEEGRVFVMVGDGGWQEGITAEALRFAAHHMLSNLTVILDYNKLQSDALVEDVMAIHPAEEATVVGFEVFECDGHNFDSIRQAFSLARLSEYAPQLVIAHTVKGKGVSYMEGNPAWHGSVVMTTEQLEAALEELS